MSSARWLIGAALLLGIALPVIWLAAGLVLVGLPLWLAHGWLRGATARERARAAAEAATREAGTRRFLSEHRLMDTPENRGLILFARPRRGRSRNG
jgi:hypothetical protein